MYLNKVIIIGNLTRDPELKSLPSGMKVCSLGLATNRVWKDKDGQKQEATEYHSVSVFGRQAETSGQYLKKGQNVLVEGRLQTRSWEGKDGEKKYKTEIVAESVQFGAKAMGASSSSSKESNKSNEDEEPSSGGSIEYPADEIKAEDIPF